MNKEKIIVALDVATAAEARQIISDLDGEVGAFKIGLQLFTSVGSSFVQETVAAGTKIFLDLKFHDIPNTVAQSSIEAARLGVWMFNVHAVGGAEMMQRTIESVSEICVKENLAQPKIIAVTVLTSADVKTLREVGIAAEPSAQVIRLARLTAECGLHGVVASPREIAMIRANVEEKDFLIVTPGIRNRPAEIKDQTVKSPDFSETSDDQKRVMTATDAVSAGADYLVIGRPILQAADRVSAARNIIREIEGA